MDTPICDFARDYAASDALRLHMPGHKGAGPLGCENLDITEIAGADSLYEADGIIRRSEANASSLFGCPTFYSTEGSSQCIRAALYLAALHAKQAGKTPHIAAGRNAHRTFLSAAALLDLQVTWLQPEEHSSYLSCPLTARRLEACFAGAPDITAVYVTSPDYLGNMAPIRELAEVCRRHGALLIVDNAHGAYLRFLPESAHPIDLGADLCCDSAHKTLPVLTGGAYLHIAARRPGLAAQAKPALALFGSTSPSYLILQSLDAANRCLAEGYPGRLADFTQALAAEKARLQQAGYLLQGDEPLKLTLCTKAYGYTGTALAKRLQEDHIVCEFADPDFLVFMLTPETGRNGLERLCRALLAVPRQRPILQQAPAFSVPERVMGIREAMFSPCQTVPAAQSVGRVLAAATVGCPPAVPILVCGERIDAAAVRCFAYYGIETCMVVTE